jgi:hypothetical protein
MMNPKQFSPKIRQSIARKRKKIANVGFAKKLDITVMNAQTQNKIRPKPES